MIAVSLLAGAGCNKTPPKTDEVAEAQKKLADEMKETSKELSTEKKDLAAAKLDLAKARLELEAAVTERMTKIDAKLVELDQKADEASKAAAINLRARRDEVKAKLAQMADRTETNWDAFKTDVITSWDLLAKDVDAAVK